MKRVGKGKVEVVKWFGSKKDMACIRTICSHITNMATGVTKVNYTSHQCL